MKKILLLIGISLFVSIEGFYYFTDQFFPIEASKIGIDNYIFKRTLQRLMEKYGESNTYEDLMWFSNRIDFLINSTRQEDIINGLNEEMEKTLDSGIKGLLQKMIDQFATPTTTPKKISLLSKIKEAISKVKDYFVSKFIKSKDKLKKSYDEISTQELVEVYNNALEKISNLQKFHNYQTGQPARDIYIRGYLERLDFLPLNSLEPIMKEIGGKLTNILIENPGAILAHGLRDSWAVFKKIKKYLNIKDPDKFMKDFIKNYLNDNSTYYSPITNELDWDGIKEIMNELGVSLETRSKVTDNFFVDSLHSLEQYLIKVGPANSVFDLSSAINNLASLTEDERKTVLSKIGKKLVDLIKKYPKSIFEVYEVTPIISSNFKKIQSDLSLSNNDVIEIITGKKVSQNNISPSGPVENNNEQITSEDNNNIRNTSEI